MAIDLLEIETIIKKCIESVNRMTFKAELLIQKANSLFQAQLMTAKTDQVKKFYYKKTFLDVESLFIDS